MPFKKRKNYETSSNFLSFINNILGITYSVIVLAPLLIGVFSTHKFLILVAVCLLIPLILFFVFHRRISEWFMVRLLNSTAPDGTQKIMSKEVIYTYKDRETVSFESKFTVKILHGVCSEVCDKIKWTAGLIRRAECIVPNQKIVFLEETSASQANIERQNFKIVLPKEYTSKDEPFKTGFKVAELKDPEHKAMPRLLVGIYDKSGPLTLRVNFAPGLSPVRIRRLKFAHFIDSAHYASDPADLKYDEETGYNYVEFYIKNPIYGGKYVIDWEFSPGKG